LFAGLGAGITEAVLIVTPFEVIKIRLQQQKGLDKSQLKYRGVLQSANLILKEEGVTALVSYQTPQICTQSICV
jgi:solute carrier family 25 (mitochondrial citrate transporter), member 1